jgi:hypothetical protein
MNEYIDDTRQVPINYEFKEELLACGIAPYNTSSSTRQATNVAGSFRDFVQAIQVTKGSRASTDADTRTSEQLFAQGLESYSDPADVQLGAVAVYDRLTAYLQSDLARCDDLLAAVNVSRVNLRLLLALLMGTSQFPKNIIPSRAGLFKETVARYRRESPSEAEEIFKYIK